ncbi:MAG: S49 family peptidase [Chloroflexi bacterium]|nr:S49 family peptidase [Chloroflexota bacterium]
MAEDAQSTEAVDADPIEASLARARTVWGIIAVIILGAIGGGVGLWASQQVAPQPVIGIVRLYGTIDFFSYADYLGPLHIAAERDDVAAVVILVDSGGGLATVSEELFYTVLDLREDKPVVASIEGVSASGAYYATAPANWMVARPAAIVGSIGVRSGFPPESFPDDETLTTGPFKDVGRSTTDFLRDIDSIALAFSTNIYDQRSWVLENMHEESRLDLLPPVEEVATGQVWTAARAFELGLVDEIGSNLDAIERAAELAGVRNYEVIDLFAEFIELDDTDFAGFSTDRPEPTWYEEGPWPQFYYFYGTDEE